MFHRVSKLRLNGELRDSAIFEQSSQDFAKEISRLCRTVDHVIATCSDGGVPFDHAQSLAAAIRGAELAESTADSHFMWFGRDWPAIAETILTFLAVDPLSAGDPRSVRG